MDEAEALARGLLTYIGKDVDDAYIAAVKKLSVNPELAREMGKTLKIVYTPLHGSGNIPVRRIFREIGMENVYVVPEQELPDGDFPTVKVPNPEDPGAFALALKMQEKLGADLCVGTDPDCDRVGIACMTEATRGCSTATRSAASCCTTSSARRRSAANCRPTPPRSPRSSARTWPPPSRSRSAAR